MPNIKKLSKYTPFSLDWEVLRPTYETFISPLTMHSKALETLILTLIAGFGSCSIY